MNTKDKEVLKMNKVNKNNQVEYEEYVEDFTGLIFHCPKCKAEFHLHISEVKSVKKPVLNKLKGEKE